MRIPALLLIVVVGTAPACAFDRITVRQLEQAVAGADHPSDGALARKLGGLELTQRISVARFSRLDAALPGRKSHEALTILADRSAFLDLPDEELPTLPPPDAAAQAQIVSRALDFVAAAIHRMPDFSAMRHVDRFEAIQIMRGIENPVITHDQPMHLIGHSQAKVGFREGVEYIGGEPLTGRNNGNGLTTWGIFGPLLSLVTADILTGDIAFDHWEPGPSAPVAVFHYVVGEPVSHYTVTHCCFPGRSGLPHFYRARPQYHGELAIDPDSGAVLRLVLKTDFGASALYHIDPDTTVPLLRADVVVEYGSVTISGVPYICPLHSVSIAVSLARPDNDHPALDPLGNPITPMAKILERAQYMRMAAMNDIRFDNHHVYRGSMAVLPAPAQESH